jgi:hypothetical protein
LALRRATGQMSPSQSYTCDQAITPAGSTAAQVIVDGEL